MTPFQEQHWDELAAQYWFLPCCLAVLYLTLVFAGRSWFAQPEKKAWNARIPLALWNLCLAIFSILGVWFTFPLYSTIVQETQASSFSTFLCTPLEKPFGSSDVTANWILFFIISKIPELVDTFFIVVRKRPLLFLHWYHHVTVMLYCWHSAATGSSQTRLFVLMNYAVHAIMYTYYFSKSCPKESKILAPFRIIGQVIPPALITTLQILQMVVGCVVQGLSLFLVFVEPYSYQCTSINKTNAALGAAMYLSYFCLFVHFALHRYVFSSSPSAPKKEKTT